MNGYLRRDGRKGIRNATVVVYLVECAHHVAGGAQTASKSLVHKTSRSGRDVCRFAEE